MILYVDTESNLAIQSYPRMQEVRPYVPQGKPGFPPSLQERAHQVLLVSKLILKSGCFVIVYPFHALSLKAVNVNLPVAELRYKPRIVALLDHLLLVVRHGAYVFPCERVVNISLKFHSLCHRFKSPEILYNAARMNNKNPDSVLLIIINRPPPIISNTLIIECHSLTFIQSAPMNYLSLNYTTFSAFHSQKCHLPFLHEVFVQFFPHMTS